MASTHKSATVRLIVGAACAIATAVGVGCSTYREEGGGRSIAENRSTKAESAIARFKAEDPTLERFFDTSYGYAVFPKVTKGGAGIGAAHGVGGTVYEQGKVVGYSTLTQITLGAQLGGQEFEELIFFQNKTALDTFKNGNTEFAANASAVATTSGSASSSDFDKGVAVFTLPIGGLMLEASIGGQKFSYMPAESAQASALNE